MGREQEKLESSLYRTTGQGKYLKSCTVPQRFEHSIKITDYHFSQKNAACPDDALLLGILQIVMLNLVPKLSD